MTGGPAITTAVAFVVGGCALDDEGVELDEAELGCGAPGAYTPYTVKGPMGSVAEHPWVDEDFQAYAPPEVVECSSAKQQAPHLDVTSGCLRAVAVGAYLRGQVEAPNQAFRALALGRVPGAAAPVRWTDQSVEYRFHFAAPTGTINNPGFKAFVRYRTEDDLYVASWRMDGVVQIQKKQCGAYTTLARRTDLGAPSAGAWHRLRFVAEGDRLELYLDRSLVLQATSKSLSWGTAGIRIDSMNGAYVDDWQVAAP